MLFSDETTRAKDVRTGRSLELLTIGWNSLEALIAVTAGLIAGSVALVGFGFDSVIEISSGVALLWRLSLDADPYRRERMEATTLKFVGTTFVLLAAYVAFDAMTALWKREAPAASYVGIVLAALSLIVMPMLASAKRRVASQIQSKALQADSRQTDICAYLSAILLGGLLLNAMFGWWWADPIAALIMVPIIAKEGREAWRGETCCDSCH
jgi:divalent metal cation (Fe/Co/Zn/Cd) transporter